MQRRQAQESVKGMQESEVAGFISKTFEILDNEEFHKVIQWASNGLQFVIKDVLKLEQQILPRFFRHNKINSFVRQLNMYGFHKIKNTNLRSTFRHPYFQKGQPHLLTLVTRKTKAVETREEIKVVPQAAPQVKVDFFANDREEDKWSTNLFLNSSNRLNSELKGMSYSSLIDTSPVRAQKDDDCLSIQHEIDSSQRTAEKEDEICFINSVLNLK